MCVVDFCHVTLIIKIKQRKHYQVTETKGLSVAVFKPVITGAAQIQNTRSTMAPLTSDEHLQALFEELEQKREEWLDEGGGNNGDFKVILIGGQFPALRAAALGRGPPSRGFQGILDNSCRVRSAYGINIYCLRFLFVLTSCIFTGAQLNQDIVNILRGKIPQKHLGKQALFQHRTML